MTLEDFHARHQILLDIFAAYYKGLLLGIPTEDPSTEQEWIAEYQKFLSRVLH